MHPLLRWEQTAAVIDPSTASVLRTATSVSNFRIVEAASEGINADTVMMRSSHDSSLSHLMHSRGNNVAATSEEAEITEIETVKQQRDVKTEEEIKIEAEREIETGKFAIAVANLLRIAAEAEENKIGFERKLLAVAEESYSNQVATIVEAEDEEIGEGRGRDRDRLHHVLAQALGQLRINLRRRLFEIDLRLRCTHAERRTSRRNIADEG